MLSQEVYGGVLAHDVLLLIGYHELLFVDDLLQGMGFRVEVMAVRVEVDQPMFVCIALYVFVEIRIRVVDLVPARTAWTTQAVFEVVDRRTLSTYLPSSPILGAYRSGSTTRAIVF